MHVFQIFFVLQTIWGPNMTLGWVMRKDTRFGGLAVVSSFAEVGNPPRAQPEGSTSPAGGGGGDYESFKQGDKSSLNMKALPIFCAHVQFA